MDRLTIRVKKGKRKGECFLPGNKNAITKVEYIHDDGRWESEEYKGKAVDKLAEYEDLEEQGKLLKLPCAVGDTVHYADNEYYFTVLPVKVDEIAIMESNEILYKCLLFDGNGDVETQFDFDKDDFEKTVFLTKEAAEAALKEMSE
ncbi:hypothetical protein E5329_23805 [Petralouisia muris]|uniref:Uncharacterized protein n=1 Tax=Petralouisia muris TaxID=3032872 RepID=A0AC61RPB0_9FIRM|nr:hypothetical protein [Petralouisia muris]TGY90866.1 hypothetical protein E5329_23805 [Petralouisia muris]